MGTFLRKLFQAGDQLQLLGNNQTCIENIILGLDKLHKIKNEFMVEKLLPVVILKWLFKGSLTRDFRLQVSFPLDPEYPIGVISNFYENSRNSLLCVVDAL